VTADDPTQAQAHGLAVTRQKDDDSAPGDQFSRVARLELDQLLEQLISRARDVQATQGRLQGLLRANHTVASAVDLDDVLGHIVEAARELVDARYAALGVVDRGRLVRFLHAGMADADVAAIGHLPEGKGLLGRLIDYPQPLRLPEIGAHLSSVGFPDNHPPMRSFLGVPITVGRQIYGNLYLTDKVGAAEFSVDDQELVIALASAAGAAITNAALFADSRRRQQWHAAMAALSTAVLTSDDPDSAPELILRYAVETTGCADLSVVVPAEQAGYVRVAAAAGALADRVGAVLPIEATVYEQAMTMQRSIVIADLAMDHRTADWAITGVGPTVAVPMRTDLAVDGVLFVCHRPGEPPFDSVDLEMLASYASHAALVRQLAASRQVTEQVRMVEDRRLIAEELHAGVVQRLSRLGLDLQGLASRTADARTRESLQAKVDETDELIKALRQAIFGLGGPEPTAR
jgi:GAF domain-containing protein